MNEKIFNSIMEEWDLLRESIVELGGYYNSIQDGNEEENENETIICYYDSNVEIKKTFKEIDERIDELYEKTVEIAKGMKTKIEYAEEIFDSCIVNRYEIYKFIMKQRKINLCNIHYKLSNKQAKLQ